MKEPNWNKLDAEWLRAAQEAYDAQVTDDVLDQAIDIMIEKEIET